MTRQQRNGRRPRNTARFNRGLRRDRQLQQLTQAQARHRAADPHCTCNDCVAQHFEQVRCPGLSVEGDQCELLQGHEGPCEVRDTIDPETGQVLR